MKHEDDAPEGNRGEWLTDRALRSLLWGLKKMPYDRRVPMMGRALRRAIGPLAGFRRRIDTNLRFIKPDMSASDRRILAGDVLDNFGRTLIENYSHKDLAARLKSTPLQGAGVSPLAAARKEGRPVVFVTGHFGNHEAPRHVLTREGYTVGGLFRPMRNAFVNDHYAQTMTSWGGPVFSQGRRGTIGFARHLAKGGMGTLLFDVHTVNGEPIPFLGQPAMTATSAAELALKFDALLIPYFGIRRPDGLSFDIHIEQPITRSDAVTMTRDATDRLEARIAQNPGQWFWVHRRWKAGDLSPAEQHPEQDR